jgi:hypothetical protein
MVILGFGMYVFDHHDLSALELINHAYAAIELRVVKHWPLTHARMDISRPSMQILERTSSVGVRARDSECCDSTSCKAETPSTRV